MVLRLRGGPGPSIGFAVGGAKDVGNFRNNIKEGFYPKPSSITIEGLFNEYFFDTGNDDEQKIDKLFYPSYSFAVSPGIQPRNDKSNVIDPFSNQEELWMTVGLNSNVTDFARKKLNLVVLLDISGSMNDCFANSNDEQRKTKVNHTIQFQI